MILRRLVAPAGLVALALAVPELVPWHVQPRAGVVFAQSDQARPHFASVGGTIMTNLAVIGTSTTLGTATGDLRGGVAATILKVSPGPSGTTIFSVQHHFVTETGDTILVRPAEATVAPVTPTLFAVITYPLEIIGGTGKFAGATGSFYNIGEVDIPNYPDLAGGRTVFRYSGQVCLAAPSSP